LANLRRPRRPPLLPAARITPPLYPLLSRLRRTGWVATTWQESPAGPPRRYYELTSQGKEALAHFRSEWVAFRTAVDRIVGTEHT
jgi:PadR family transcriptional regulator, regulatory protein PadR